MNNVIRKSLFFAFCVLVVLPLCGAGSEEIDSESEEVGPYRTGKIVDLRSSEVKVTDFFVNFNNKKYFLGYKLVKNTDFFKSESAVSKKVINRQFRDFVESMRIADNALHEFETSFDDENAVQIYRGTSGSSVSKKYVQGIFEGIPGVKLFAESYEEYLKNNADRLEEVKILNQLQRLGLTSHKQ